MEQIRKKLSFAELVVEIHKIGKEYCIHVGGGSSPHIGCVVLAMPRPSLKDANRVSTTSSVLNISGHQDEQICRLLAEAAARGEKTITVCTGGFHVDNITNEQIQELMKCISDLAKEKWDAKL